MSHASADAKLALATEAKKIDGVIAKKSTNVDLGCVDYRIESRQ